MSDRIKTDNKYFIEKFKLELRRVNRAMSGMFKLAHDRGAKKTDDKMHFLFGEASRINGRYFGMMYHTIDSLISVRKTLDPAEKKNKLEKKRVEADSFFRHKFANCIHNDHPIKIEVRMTNDNCGVMTDPQRFVIPINIQKLSNEIGNLSANKIIVFAKTHHHDTFKCWRAQYYTFNRVNSRKHYKSVDCFIMKDPHSGLTYYHIDYRLCAEGLRRAIGRKVAKRMGL